VDFAKTVLIWMAQDPDRVATLLAQTGVAVEDLRNLADEPEFLGGVLDVLLHDEAALIAFCDETHHAYEAPAHARATLPGGEVPHWT
jgi:hypothetical protein